MLQPDPSCQLTVLAVSNSSVKYSTSDGSGGMTGSVVVIVGGGVGLALSVAVGSEVTSVSGKAVTVVSPVGSGEMVTICVTDGDRVTVSGASGVGIGVCVSVTSSVVGVK